LLVSGGERVINEWTAIAADRDATVAGNLLQHQKRRIALRPPVGLE